MNEVADVVKILSEKEETQILSLKSLLERNEDFLKLDKNKR